MEVTNIAVGNKNELEIYCMFCCYLCGEDNVIILKCGYIIVCAITIIENDPCIGSKAVRMGIICFSSLDVV